MNEEIRILKEKVKNLKVMYIEDEDEMRMGTELFLNKFFSFVQTAKDGEDGLQKFKDGKYDVVFTDILMPKMGGLEMLEKIREIDNNIFTVALTASEVDRNEIEETVNLYFRKPITYENMFVIMQEIVKKFDLK
ncbi:MAG: response regulator [Arcobacteraceae bacterium]|nr:response regulator [Arcobacteraceae bacterium]